MNAGCREGKPRGSALLLYTGADRLSWEMVTVSAETSLEAPSLLIAMPQVLDPFFHKSVVLLVHQDEEEGSFGLIVNRPTGIRISEILGGLEIGWSGGEEKAAFFGGPVQPQLGSVLFARRGPSGIGAETTSRLSAVTEITQDLGLTHHVGDLGALAEAPPERLRLYLGYAGWGAGQLMEEILRDDWLLAPVSDDLVFASDPDEVWEGALRSVGVDPAALPSWSAGAGAQTN